MLGAAPAGARPATLQQAQVDFDNWRDIKAERELQALVRGSGPAEALLLLYKVHLALGKEQAASRDLAQALRCAHGSDLFAARLTRVSSRLKTDSQRDLGFEELAELEAIPRDRLPESVRVQFYLVRA